MWLSSDMNGILTSSLGLSLNMSIQIVGGRRMSFLFKKMAKNVWFAPDAVFMQASVISFSFAPENNYTKTESSLQGR